MSAALAAATVAALSASQAPGITDTSNGRTTAGSTTPPGSDSATGDSPYFTDLPPLESPVPEDGEREPGRGKETEAGIPATVLDAYKKAEAALRDSRPGCRLPWQLLAAIGKVESGQARGGRVDSEGTTLAPIRGPQLNGDGFANIPDTDGGAYDGDTSHDRAVGPMQFIPSTWKNWAQDGNGDGKKDPNNIYDAALAAGEYLCAGDRDLSSASGLRQAILSYNRSEHYLRTVLSWLDYYRKGTHEVPDGTGVLPDDRSDGRGGRGDGQGANDRPSTGSPGSGNPAKDPSTGGSDKPRPGSGGGSGKPDTPGSGGDPSTPPTKPGGGDGESPDPDPTPTPQPEDRVARLADATGDAELTATAGSAFTTRPAVRTQGANAAGVAGVKVKFEIVGSTDTRFEGGAASATVTTDSKGKAVAPELRAGEKTGEFTVRATVVGRTLPAVEHTAKVTARQADTLTRVGDDKLSCAAGAEFAAPVEIKATRKGAAAGGVAVQATLIKSADDATVNDKGPYFMGDGDKPVRTLKDLRTAADGTLKLPKLYADDTKGTYLLRLDAAGGGTVTIELTVD